MNTPAEYAPTLMLVPFPEAVPTFAKTVLLALETVPLALPPRAKTYPPVVVFIYHPTTVLPEPVAQKLHVPLLAVPAL